MLVPILGLLLASALVIAGLALVSIPAALVVAGLVVGGVALMFLDVDRIRGGG